MRPLRAGTTQRPLACSSKPPLPRSSKGGGGSGDGASDAAAAEAWRCDQMRRHEEQQRAQAAALRPFLGFLWSKGRAFPTFMRAAAAENPAIRALWMEFEENGLRPAPHMNVVSAAAGAEAASE